jgi:hypothetical protein
MMRSGAKLIPILLLASAVSAQQIQVRMNTRLSSANAQPGTAFSGVLMNAVQINGQSCAKGSPVGGVVTEAKSSGRLSSPGILELQPTWVSCHGRRVGVSADPIKLEGKSHTKNNAVLIGGGTGLGALLGGIFGGGMGAAIGAAAGAGSGSVAAAATGKREAVIETESVVAWDVKASSAPVQTATRHNSPPPPPPPAPSYSRHGARHHDDDEDDDYDRDGDRDEHRARRVRFTEHDRVYLSRCLVSNYRLPPGLAKKGKIPPGHAKKMQQAGYTVVPGACTAELSPIPMGWERVIIDTRVVLLDSAHREIDWFVWQRGDERGE